MVGVGRDLGGSSSPNSLLKQGHLQQAAQDLISFYDQVTHLEDEGKVVDVVYLDFSKASDTVPLSILLEKLAARGVAAMLQAWGRVAGKLPGRKRTLACWSTAG